MPGAAAACRPRPVMPMIVMYAPPTGASPAPRSKPTSHDRHQTDDTPPTMAGSPGWRSGIKHPRPARDADEVDEAGEGTWVVTGLGDDSLKAVAHGVGLDEEPLAGF